MPNYYRTTLPCNHNIVPTLCYHKWAVIWSFVFLSIIISAHDFISNFVAVVNSFIIFAGVIFINLCLILMTYSFPIHLMLYRYNHINAK